jgi:hypothetical protein
MTPFALDVMKAKLGATNAYLGNAIGTCTPSRIAGVEPAAPQLMRSTG